jgi:7,8-dihydropterin-6-yl-methyl-4-(beta-D-ribofuranosyl)aminobenzene 5'-phosphate synthase
MKRTSVTRRTFLCGSAMGLVAASARSSLAKSKLPIAEVDELSVQVVTDNATFGPFLDDLGLPGLQVKRAGNGGKPGATRMSPDVLLAEFGLSLSAESRRATETRRVLVDFGYTSAVLANNLRMLGIDPSQIDASVLSHGHLDHYGGYPGLFAKSSPKNKTLPFIVGGEETFCERVALVGKPPLVMGSLDRSALKRAGFEVKVLPDPAVIADHAFTTGQIPLESFERAAIPTEMRPGVGCARDLISTAKRAATQLPDDGEHELATCYAVKGLGLVVIASCSHRGIVNSVRRARAVSGIEKVHAVIGGFHLIKPRTEEEARKTVAELSRIDPMYIIPMHCSGEVFIAEALRVLPQKVVRSYVGTRFIFASA